MARAMYTMFGWMRAHQTPDAEALTAVLSWAPAATVVRRSPDAARTIGRTLFDGE
jgi:hypothetical protein